LKTPFRYLICIVSLLLVNQVVAQHELYLNVELHPTSKKLFVQQEIVFKNTTKQVLHSLILNDWNHAYSDKNTPLGRRFSDEFVRNFHLAKDDERGKTSDLTILDSESLFLDWKRVERHPDLIEVKLRKPLNPGESSNLKLTYISYIPKDKFTKFGHNDSGDMYLKNWFLTPSRYENNDFVRYSNLNLDDIPNAQFDVQLKLKLPKNLKSFSDLNTSGVSEEEIHMVYNYSGKNRNDFNLFIGQQLNFNSYKNSIVDVVTNLKENRLSSIQKAVVIDRIVHYVNTRVGNYPFEKITVSQVDYERNPFYGLNQLPSFISPFPDEFIFELKFLKTYLNNFLQNTLQINHRSDSWVHDGIQVYLMMQYIDENYPEMKMMGTISKMKLLKSYNLTNVDFNEQYSYFYMLMARKNLDQPIGNPKNSFIKFNEQIAGKYRAGLSLKYLDNFLGNNSVNQSIAEFYAVSLEKQTDRCDFEDLLQEKTPKSLDWFFKTIINSRDIIDYKFKDLKKSKDSVEITLKNKTGITVPIPVYGIKDSKVVFKNWIENVSTDTVLVYPRNDIDKLVINYKNEVPEYNLRNNWKSTKPFVITNRPIKFNLMKDLEDPFYNQILYVPTISYNLYDGLTPGLRFHNKTILDKPFVFDLNPAYSSLTHSLVGNFGLVHLHNRRNHNLYQIRYSINGSYFHYAPDASYMKLTPMAILRMRPSSFRDNRKEFFVFRNIFVNREQNDYTILKPDNDSYSIFNAKYINTRTELRDHFSVKSDLQLASMFGKSMIELEYRNLFDNNRQLNVRFFAGSFLYRNTNSDFYSFGISQANDYLFDYNLYGRSETTGFFSQQYVVAEGGFKSRFDDSFANQWITSINSSINIWNWIEVYGDAGVYKNKYSSEKFIYNSGIRLNLVTDYFEVYFPVHSTSGWEIGQKNYQEHIRFMITLNPEILVGLFTRKWF